MEDWVSTVLPLLKLPVVLLLTDGDDTPPEHQLRAMFESGKVLLVLGINMPHLWPRIHHLPLGLNNNDRYSGNETLLSPFFDASFSRGPLHLREAWEAKKPRVFMPKLGSSHAVRRDVEAWLKSGAPGTQLIDYHEDLGIGHDFTAYLVRWSCRCWLAGPRGA